MAMTRPVHCGALCVLAALVLTIPRATRADMCAYVVIPGNEGIAVVDVTSQAKVADIYVGQSPVAAAIGRQAQAIYVMRVGDETALSVLETAAYRVVKEIPLPGYYGTVAVSSNGRFAYLTDIYGGGLDVVDLTAGEVVRRIDDGRNDPPLGFALTSDGTRLFTPGPGDFRYIEPTGWEAIGSVSIIDTASGRLTDTITLPLNSEEALAVLLSPDEQRAYVAVWPPRQGVLVLDLASHTVVDQFENVGPLIALSPDGSRLYTVEGHWPDPAVGAMAAINVETKAVQTIPLGTLAVLGRPILAVAPESSLVYVAFDRSPFVFAVDTETQSVVAQFEVAGNPSDIAVGHINGPCRPANYTPPRTPTPTPTPTVTPTHAPTFQCPPGVPCLEISSASIPAGGEATITVHLTTAGQQIAGIQNDISFDSPIAVHDCKVSSDLPPLLGGFYSFSSSLRALFYTPARAGQTVISDGTLLYSCTVTVASDAPLGKYPLIALNIGGSDGRGKAVTVASADGEVVVTTGRNAAYTPQPTATPTVTPITTPTEAPTSQCPPGVPCLEISSASIPAGGEATIAVHLITAGQQIAGIQNDISFDSHIAVHDCSSGLSFVEGFNDFGSSLRAEIYSPSGSGQTVISDGALLYSCTVTVASDAPLGKYALVALNIYGSDGRGNAITVAGADGEVVVTTGRSAAAPPGISAGASTSTSSGCQIINGPAVDSFWLGLVIPMLLLRRRRTEKCVSPDATIPRWQSDQV